jgi:uncharacterized protein YybS (DUF2232 family)
MMELSMQQQQDFIRLYEEFAASYGKQQQALLQQQAEAMFKMIFVTSPFLSAFVLALMTYFVFRILLRFQRVTVPPLRHFLDWGVSDNLVWIFILSGVLYHFEATRILGINLILGSVFLFYLQGGAVIACILKQRGVAKFVQFVSYVLLLLQIPYSLISLGLLLTGSASEGLIISLPAMVLVAGIGLANVWIDFRTRLKQANL